MVKNSLNSTMDFSKNSEILYLKINHLLNNLIYFKLKFSMARVSMVSGYKRYRFSETIMLNLVNRRSQLALENTMELMDLKTVLKIGKLSLTLLLYRHT